MPLQQAIEQAKQNMFQAAGNDLQGLFNNYKRRITEINRTLSNYRQLDAVNFKGEYFLSESARSAAAMWQTRRKVNDAQYEKAIRQGYILLNEIGETLRGRKITYSIILKVDKGNTHYQWDDLSIDEFLQMTTMYYTSSDNKLGRNLRLMSNASMLEQLKIIEQKKLGKKLSDQQFQSILASKRWSESKEAAYQYFNIMARTSWVGGTVEEKREDGTVTTKARWRDVNEGNITEAFLYSEKYNTTIKHSMLQTMLRPDAFWQGGDIDDVQIKSTGASVTNVSTLISQLTDVYNILTKIEQKVRSGGNQNSVVSTGEIVAKAQTEIDEFITKFLSNKLKFN